MTSTQQDYSKIITTVNSVTQNISIIPDRHNVIVIDTSDNRLGINTINPQYSIDVRDNPDISGIIYGDHIQTSTVISDLIPDIDICYNLGSQNNRWKNIYVNNIVSQQHTVDTMTIGGNTINIRNDAGNIVPALGYNETENKVELKSDIYAQDIDLDNIHIRNPSGLTFNSENVSDSDTIAFPTNIDISKNLVVNGDSQFLGKVSVKDNANDLILIDKTNPNIILINLQENQQVKINGKLLVTGEIDNDYLIQLIQGQTSSIRVNNDRILNKTNFYTLYDGLSQLDVTLDINSSNDVSFNAYKSLNDISCGFTDDYSNYNGYNIFFTNQSYDDIKLLSNDRKHLSYYNQFDLSSSDFSIIYNDGSELFYEIHNKADIDSRNNPSSKQIKFLKDLLRNMSEKEQDKILEGRDIKSLTREEIGPIIDDAKTLSGPRKASKKQIDKIIEICEKLSLDLDEFLKENGIEDLENLTGGRDGSASVLIGKLFDVRGNNPATENQIKAIRNISKYLEIEIEDAMAIVKTTTIEEINFNDASELIGKLKKMKKK